MEADVLKVLPRAGDIDKGNENFNHDKGQPCRVLNWVPRVSYRCAIVLGSIHEEQNAEEIISDLREGSNEMMEIITKWTRIHLLFAKYN
jgi:hypothetical protein